MGAMQHALWDSVAVAHATREGKELAQVRMVGGSLREGHISWFFGIVYWGVCRLSPVNKKNLQVLKHDVVHSLDMGEARSVPAAWTRPTIAERLEFRSCLTAGSWRRSGWMPTLSLWKHIPKCCLKSLLWNVLGTPRGDAAKKGGAVIIRPHWPFLPDAVG